ncbi:unnamed protein product, partial [Ectocarpus sp. 12 AP-2014]
EFPLPGILQAFPQPVAVRVDEGTELGAKRVVVFAGREGRGELHLEVVEREGLRSVFETVSDSTPMANWIAITSITYEVVPHDQGSLLRVTLDYERLLAPSLIFEPMMAFAGNLSMGVLAEDTKARAEMEP